MCESVNECAPPGVEGGELLGVDRSDLLPTSIVVRFGDASARASERNMGREEKVEWRVMSYMRSAPAAPR